nr:reverse transcriptase domain-containing protein [Tanacetum cinerariifolium]
MIRTWPSKERKRKAREATEDWMNTPITFPSVSSEDISDEPLIVEAEVEGYLIRRVYVDEGASVEVIQVEMDDPNISMEEYIELKIIKARMHVRRLIGRLPHTVRSYYKDIDYFKDFKTDFPAIVYKDALVSNHEISSKPTTELEKYMAFNDRTVDYDKLE